MKKSPSDLAEPNEMIALDSPFGRGLGFTSDKFFGYLWLRDNAVYISLIESLHPGRGQFSALLDAIWQRGLAVKVPTPLGSMRSILDHKGFHQTWEPFDELGEACEVWVKEAE